MAVPLDFKRQKELHAQFIHRILFLSGLAVRLLPHVTCLTFNAGALAILPVLHNEHFS